MASRAMTVNGSLPRGSERVLLVDDDDQVRRALALLLENLGYETRTVANAGEALAVLRRSGLALDLMISDIVMPGMDGVELARQVRDTLPHLRVLLISGYSDRKLPAIEDALFLRKPFSIQELAHAVRECLEPRSDPAEALRDGRCH